MYKKKLYLKPKIQRRSNTQKTRWKTDFNGMPNYLGLFQAES